MHSPPSLPSTLLAAPAHPSQVIAIWNSYVWNNIPAVLLNHINNIYVHIGSTPFLTVKVFTKFYTPATSLLIFSLRLRFVISKNVNSVPTFTFSVSRVLCCLSCFISLGLHDVDIGGLVAFCCVLGGELSISTGNCFYIVNNQMWLKYTFYTVYM